MVSVCTDVHWEGVGKRESLIWMNYMMYVHETIWKMCKGEIGCEKKKQRKIDAGKFPSLQDNINSNFSKTMGWGCSGDGTFNHF